MSDVEGTERAAKVKAWLKEEDYFSEQLDVPDQIAVYRCNIGGDKLPVSVIIPLKGQAVWINLQINFPGNLERQLNNLLDEDETFLPNLRLAFVYVGCQVQLLGKNGNDYEVDQYLSLMRLLTGVHYDGLTKETLMRGIERIERAIQALSIILKTKGVRLKSGGSFQYA